ncbi:CBS domain-containing protein [Nonomuraea sp. PA05]|uniref:CBS domain-containing protein n=1 Tax=Nonomuraea sp. PA05 TaxID=2604466 RepID=UPI0011D832D3|nr:CBS domain-containing protein [Nonomuraea sp. PA05]TYB60191.1 CBS domain-containing protein [Nonomuraea sp. PA05]
MHVTVNEVMTREVISVHEATPFKDIAEALIEHGVSAVPVIDDAGHVLGVVSEADLLCKEEFQELYYQEGYKPPLRARLRHRLSPENADMRRKATGDTAAELMTTPAVTIPATAPVVKAARAMDQHGVKRLVVTADDGTLRGIVSRRDLLKVFVRSDADIARTIREDVLERSLWVETLGIKVQADHGVVTLTGWMDRRSDARVAARMAGRVDGVVDVIDKLSWKHDDTNWGR